MRWHFVLLFTPVEMDHLHRENGQATVWVDCDAEKSGIRVDEPVEEAGAQIVENSCFGEVGEVGHVFAFLVFRGVHLEHIVALKAQGLVICLNIKIF